MPINKVRSAVLGPDIGRDGGGIFRNITRDFRVPDILFDGQNENLEWHAIAKLLVHPNAVEPLNITILDTVIVENAEVVSYLFTDVSGQISRKPKRYENLRKVREEFMKISMNYEALHSKYVAICQESGKPVRLLNMDDLKSLCLGTTPIDPFVVQCYVPSKGDVANYRTFRTKFWLDRTARQNMKTDRLDISPAVVGTPSSKSMSFMSKTMNQTMENCCQDLVTRIQSCLQCRVVLLVTEFVQDNADKVWFTRCAECVVVREKSLTRNPSPEAYRQARTEEVADYDPTRHVQGGASEESAHSPTIGHFSDQRVAMRTSNKYFAPDEGAVDEIIANIDVARSKSRGETRLSPSRRIRATSSTILLENTISNTSHGKIAVPIPNARLGSEVPLANNTSFLGSSQLSGCQGDFCNFDLGFIENPAVGSENITGEFKLSAFRQRLMAGDGLVDDGSGSVGSHITQLMKGQRKFEAHDARNSHEDIGLENSTAMMMIPFRVIIQARQEMPLVKLQIRRHKRGEAGDYVSEENYQDVAVAGKLPSHYYQNVPCCAKCYKLYNIVENARMKALNKIALKREAKEALALGLSTGADTHSTGNSMLSKFPRSIQTNANDQQIKGSLEIAVQAIDSLTKLDIAEIKTMKKPPAAVEVVVEAVMGLLTGKIMSFEDTKRLLTGGEAFLTMMKEFKLEDVTDARLRLVEPYVDNPVFRPENVQPVSYCASKFCAWALGVVQAARWQRGLGHKRTDPFKLNKSSEDAGDKSALKTRAALAGGAEAAKSTEDLTFVEKLERKRAQKRSKDSSNPTENNGGLEKKLLSTSLRSSSQKTLMMTRHSEAPPPQVPADSFMTRSFDIAAAQGQSGPPGAGGGGRTVSPDGRLLSRRERTALHASQKKTSDRLASLNKSEGNMATVGTCKECRCADGITKMTYTVLGTLTVDVKRCNFVVVHDFFDTCDATAIAFKQIVQRHDGCQVMCFNYPGQAQTVWPRPPPAERERGAPEIILNNEWIADRIHELLQHAESDGDILLSSPFHLLGIGNGASIAAAFARRWGNKSQYRNSLKSVVSINGFLYPDAQLSSILHSACQVFESTPHNRPDIAVSYWSRFIFSEDYLKRVNPNLALNIYTAVSNPITNEGRAKITKGCLLHRDLRGTLSPEYVHTMVSANANASCAALEDSYLERTQVPLIMLQSTENFLVNASNIDPFLAGRTARHLWSHQLNVLSDSTLSKVHDITAQWVGKMSQDASDYQKYSILGKPGLRMLLDTLKNPRGAFVMWVRAGHAVYQENKPAVLDLIDVLACPTEDYTGFTELAAQTAAAQITEPVSTFKTQVEQIVSEKVGVLFKLEAPKAAIRPPAHLQERTVNIDLTVTTGPVNNIVAAAEVVNTNVDIEQESEPLLDEETNNMDTAMEIDNDPPMITVLEMISVPPAWTTKDSVQSSRNSSSKSQQLQPSDSSPSAHHSALSSPAPPAHALSSTASSSSSSSVLATSAVDSPQKSGALRASQSSGSGVVMHPNAPFPQPGVTSPKVQQNKKQLLNNATAGASLAADMSTADQRKSRAWAVEVPDVGSALELEAALAAKQKEYHELQLKLRHEQQAEETNRLGRLDADQEQRRKQYEDEDKILILKLEAELEMRRREREAAEKQRRLNLQEIEKTITKTIDFGDSVSGSTQELQQTQDMPVQELPPLRYDHPSDLPKAFTEKQDVVSQLDRMIQDEENARKNGTMTLEDYEKVQRRMALRQIERDQKLRYMATDEQQEMFEICAKLIQKIGRGYNGRKKAKKADAIRQMHKSINNKVIKAQALARGYLGRRRFTRLQKIYRQNLMQGHSVILIQSVFRAHLARKFVQRRRRFVNSRNIQRCFRGHLGRRAAHMERMRLELLRKRQISAGKIQSAWRMKVAKEEFRSMRIHILAATELQRCFRGYLGRKKMARRRQWEGAKPGPERIKLGLQLIEESKVAFERQQEEIDALHRAQERAEARVSHIHSELKDSEKELLVLERELQEIDQIERDLQTLTHEREILANGITDAAGLPHTAIRGHGELVKGIGSNAANDPDLERRRKAEAYALEMTIQVKRAEREKKRQELETEFAAVFQEVEKKKKALERLENALADMESTRERKDREFRRLQKNLMQLLLEQKQELDDLREKGIELETATATTAAAATATALKAREHEKRSTAMFSQTEELMKFQFMSMSLSYFSSLNMLKQLRDMNADTTSAAVASSADAAAAAAAAATAANLPNIKKLDLGANDFVDLSIRKKKAELQASEAAEREVQVSKSGRMPDDVRMWTVSDVGKWLDSLFLGQYGAAFRDAAVDGPFLMELREEDMVQVLGISHKLHTRKIMISREKLKPLTLKEKQLKEVVETEDNAEKIRADMGMPDLDAVFSQARNGRIKRVEESLNLGFAVDAEDERGNTLLLTAAQNSNKRLVEMLLLRGAKVNHQNAQGNTALHFALAFDAEGALGEYLIEHGANDAIENIDGLTPYDGVAS